VDKKLGKKWPVMDNSEARDFVNDIAVVGMAARFPGAKNLGQFWRNLREGVESISFFPDRELETAGIDRDVFSRPDYVKAWGILEDVETFDASFFGYSPQEAAIIDPQHRIFLECAWEALERAGYDSEQYEGIIGVFAGVGLGYYLLSNLYSNRDLVEQLGWQVRIGNNADHLTTRVSYELNLTGPSLDVQTACSTSLVCVCLACQSLLSYQCDMVLAGGVSVRVPQVEGYLYQEGGILSPDGHCRAFDASAQGTSPGNGVGVVVLKRVEDALSDGDSIMAIIKGSAINNDGAFKVGYVAPSVDGQAKAIAMAQALAGVDPETITYVEAHGTGTALGDPIEVAALTQAFRSKTKKKGFCAIGSVKTNIGHLDAAAGIAGFIKTVLALEHKVIPPSLHFEKANPEINFSNSPFYVNTELREWKADAFPRRAGVSAFGLGGTNAHLVLEEAPVAIPSGPSRPAQLLLLSAKTNSALETATDNLVAHLKQEAPDIALPDVSYTLQVGRRAFGQRRMAVCRNLADAVEVLEKKGSRRVLTASSAADESERPVAFLFPGLGDHYPNMASDLYRNEKVFRKCIDYCSELLRPYLGLDLRDALFSEPVSMQGDKVHSDRGIDLRKMLDRGSSDDDVSWGELGRTGIAQPAVFVVEYALAKLWMEWGIFPQAMIGHSLGEYVAACLAGVFSLEDALMLVAKRARLIESLPAGSMLALPLGPEDVRSLLGNDLSLSAINGSSLCVVSGAPEAVDVLERQMMEQGVACRRLSAPHAFHSRMMAPIAEDLNRLVAGVRQQPPRIPYLSNVTGTWITEEDLDPSYWGRHLCQTVRFSDGIAALLGESKWLLLEVGPGQSLGGFARMHTTGQGDWEQMVLASLRYAYNQQSDVEFILDTLGKLWLAGAKVNWPKFHCQQRRRRIPLPTYPFERKRYWVEKQEPAWTVKDRSMTGRKARLDDWFFTPAWQQTSLLSLEDGEARNWLIFVDGQGLGKAVVERLRAQGHKVTTVNVGTEFGFREKGGYTLDPRDKDDYIALFQSLEMREKLPDVVAHMWSLTSGDEPSNLVFFEQVQSVGYYSVLFLAQALNTIAPGRDVHIGVIANGVYEVSGGDAVQPEKAPLLGLSRVVPQEHHNLSCACIDVLLPAAGTRQARQAIDSLVAELTNESHDGSVAYRGCKRWVQMYMPLSLPSDGVPKHSLREQGVYLITGGLGNVGYAVGQYLAREFGARLVLSSRAALPPRTEWEGCLASQDGQGRVGERIRRVLHLEKLGAEVVVARADVADEAEMHDLVTQVYERFGQLDGVLHAAGVVSGPSIGRFVIETGRTESETQFRPKVRGLYVLEKVLADRDIDFCLLFSSNAAVLGGLGFAAYAAANAFLDAFSIHRNQTGQVSWLSVNWDPWPSQGKQIDTLQTQVAQYAMTLEESHEAFRRIVCYADGGQVTVATGDLLARLDLWVNRTAGEDDLTGRVHERPLLSTEYVAPRDETERVIADIWGEMLGLERVGIYDSFFDLGGHSLLAMQLLNHLRQAFGVEIPVRDLFEYTTVADQATVFKERAIQATGESDEPIAQRLETAFPTEREHLLEEYLRRLIADSLGIEVDQILGDTRTASRDLELITVDLMRRVKDDLGLQLYPHEIVGCASIQELAGFALAEYDRLADLPSLATKIPLAAYALKPPKTQATASRASAGVGKNRRMIFLLSSPRAGSTLLRVMLAGHADLFCPPELNLLFFETMREWHDGLGFDQGLWWRAQGVHAAFVRLLELGIDEGWSYIDDLVAENKSVRQVYRQIQDLIGGRLLVDKTPMYALDRQTLDCAETMFEAPVYVFLVRHPYAVIDSLLRARFDRMFGSMLFKERVPDPYVVAETVWAVCNRNLLQFLDKIPRERQYLIRYEDLVVEPSQTMMDLCQFLNISYDKALLHPYAGRKDRMIVGIGDPNILQHDGIDASLAAVWKKIALPRALDGSTEQLARQLGYELVEEKDVPQDDGMSLIGWDQVEAGQLLDPYELSDKEVSAMLAELLANEENTPK
jgi:phthiocerol/phenolphthiocerol synthesis type-I polyketide synthase E